MSELCLSVVSDFEYQPRVFALQSSLIVEGLYADESQLEVTSANQNHDIVAHPSGPVLSHPFGRAGIRRVGENVVISYGHAEAEITLQAASAVTGPYQVDLAAQVNLANRTISSPGTGVARFYRLRSTPPPDHSFN